MPKPETRKTTRVARCADRPGLEALPSPTSSRTIAGSTLTVRLFCKTTGSSALPLAVIDSCFRSYAMQAYPLGYSLAPNGSNRFALAIGHDIAEGLQSTHFSR